MEIINPLEELEEDELKARLAEAALPRHVAVIMDGNGRWAHNRGWARIRGHQAGVKAVRETVTACRDLGIPYLTLYAFSSENWQRPTAEVGALMTLLANYLVGEREELVSRGIRLKTIGRVEALPAGARRELAKTMALTEGLDKLTLTLALSYGGRDEIVDAIRSLVASGVKPADVDENAVAARLYAPDHPDPDLLIRTSGEMRVSNFMLWQIAYTEIYVTGVLWPDFQPKHLYAALLDYAARERRFGRVVSGGG